MGVFEYEHERKRVLVQQKEEATLEMQEGVCSKKSRKEVARYTMEMGVVLGGVVDSTCGFSDEEVNENTPQETTETVSPEEELVEARRMLRLEIESEGRLASPGSFR
jgi:hypothetical protein